MVLPCSTGHCFASSIKTKLPKLGLDTGGQCIAGALAKLQKIMDGQAGTQWADADKALGRFLYSTYTEKDYNVIWENYMYISRDNWWVVYDFGKANCSEAGPRRADIPARLEDVWVQQVSALSPSSQKSLIRNPKETCMKNEDAQLHPVVSRPTVLINGQCVVTTISKLLCAVLGNVSGHAPLHSVESRPSALMNVACPAVIPFSAFHCLLSEAEYLSYPSYAVSLNGHAVQQHDCACLRSHAARATFALLNVTPQPHSRLNKDFHVFCLK